MGELVAAARPRLPHRPDPLGRRRPRGRLAPHQPALPGEAFEESLRLADRVVELADDIGATPAQVALAWVLARGDDLVPTPGTKSPQRLEENAAAADPELTDAQVAELDAAVARDAVRGARYDESGMAMLNN